MKASVLISGGSGFIAGSLLRQARPSLETHVLSRGKALYEQAHIRWHACQAQDLRSMSTLLDELRPQAIIHTAALADIDYCQSHQEEARRVNTAWPEFLAQKAQALDARFIFLSTDNVFDGKHGSYREEDPPKPVNFYGETKVAAEEAVRAQCPNHVIARVSVVMGLPMVGSGNSFLSRMLPALEKGEALGVPDDEIRSPIDIVTVGRALLELAENDYCGDIHLSGDAVLTRYEMVRRIARHLGHDPHKVHANDPTSIPGRAPRPHDVSLNNTKAKSILACSFCGIETGMDRILAMR